MSPTATFRDVQGLLWRQQPLPFEGAAVNIARTPIVLHDEFELCRKLPALRRELRITQRALGELCGRTQFSVVQWEGLQRSPSTKSTIQLSAALGFVVVLLPELDVEKHGIKYSRRD